MARNIPPLAGTQLAQAKGYREFLQIYFRETELAYAEVARRAGFSSRSYPRDVTEGRRRLTAKSLPNLVRGLRLEPEMAKVLQLLYFNEYPEEHPEALSSAVILGLLEKHRHKAMRALASPLRKKVRPPEVKVSQALETLATGLTDVVAALGNIKEGATLLEIQRRTGFVRSDLAQVLEALVEQGVVTYSGDSRRYFPESEHLDWTGQAKNQLAKLAYRSSVQRLAKAAQNHFWSDETAFVNSALSVAKQDLPQLKEELREVILKFVDRSVESQSSPDTVVQLVVGLFESRLAPSS